MRFAAQLANGFQDLGHAAAIDRMVAAETAAVGVEGQLADAGDQVAVGDELAALALLAEAEVLDLHDDGNGEAVVDGSILDVGGLHAGHLEGRLGRLPAAGVGEVETDAAALYLASLADADDLHLRTLQALGNLG